MARGEVVEREVSPRVGVLSPSALLRRLRGDGAVRPLVDPGLAGGLRDWLEDGLSELSGILEPDGPPIRVTKEALSQVLVCEAHALSRWSAPREISVELARGVLVDALFRQWATVGEIGDPLQDGLGAVRATGADDICDFVEALPEEKRLDLAEQLAQHAITIASGWPRLSPSWLARTQERIEVSLAGGSVVLTGVVDLALGSPSDGRASVCLLEVKSGARRLEHRADLHYYALLETLRSGAPPFRVATYYTATGELDAEQVAEDVMIGSLQRVLEGTLRICRLRAGVAPARTPNPLCDWCRELPTCAPGLERGGSGDRRASDEDPYAHEDRLGDLEVVSEDA
jgi:hypothetical protein